MKYAINNVTILDQGSDYHQQKISLLIENGKIKQISKKELKASKSFDGDDLYLSKGWTDLRVHLKDPGFEQDEKLEYLMESASRGGFTSILTLPNTDPVVGHKDMVKSLFNSAKPYAVNILPSAALSKNTDGEELAEMIDLHHAGAVAFTDGDKDLKNTELLAHALLYVQKFDGLIMCHAEDLEISENGQINEGETSTRLGLKGIPNIAESSRVQRNLELLEHYGGRLHFAHISTPKSLELIREAKKKKLKVSCDIAAHHLIMDDSSLMDYDSNYKTRPPLRTKKDIELFWKALKDDTIDAIVSDHKGINEEGKNLEFDLADFGIIGLETLFPMLYKKADQVIGLEKLIYKITDGPDSILKRARPAIAEGVNADLTLFSLNSEWQFNPKTGGGRPQNSPLIGHSFNSRIIATFNKGIAFVNL
ncbi:dihydroorotase [Hyphobacterium sp. CCMP332]|nr:dihydroorotase [Hyphobacterium sp. CCMP332]